MLNIMGLWQIIQEKEKYVFTLRKHAYSNILQILSPKMKILRWKILIIFMFLHKTQIVGTR